MTKASRTSEENMDQSALNAEVKRQMKILEFRTTEITPRDEFEKMLKHSIENNKPLRVKCGIDPTGCDVHLGHLVPYRKMREFQDLGHTGVVIIGDYTAQIGDPTGKNESRKKLGAEEVAENAKTYMDQVFTVLDKDKTEVRYQSDWFEKTNLHQILEWAAQTTVAKLISHDTFKKRIDEGQSLGLHELFYPVLQGIDSTMIDADVELGGSDQRFNVLMGRDYQKVQNVRPQVAMLLPIVTGLCGTQKMSKSLDNYIGVFDEPFDKFGKVMSIPDNLMPEYYQYMANLPVSEFESMNTQLKNGSIHPNEAKKQLASKIVSLFHGDEQGALMREQFERVFKKKKVPDEIEEFNLESGMNVLEVMVKAGMVSSNGEGRRMLKQNAVSIVDGDKITDPAQGIDSSFKGSVLKVGKRRFLKLV